MFKKASMKIMARDSTAPDSNQDQKPMHALISAEKAVLLSLQKLSVDYAKAAGALKTWGLAETDDLGGILTASTSLLNHYSLALSQYVAHGQTMQRQLEAISTRGDALDNLKQRRLTAHRKAEDTANQLSKMSPENKYYSMHTDALKRLRKDVRKMDSEIKLEDAAFGDFKRTTTKVWMTLKFGGLHDCCQKGTIAGKYGKLAATEISEELAQSDMPRSPYSPTKVDNLLEEADRHVNAVGHSSVGSRESIQITQEPSSASPASSPISQRGSFVSGPPLPPPKPPSHHSNNSNYHEAIQPSHGGNGHFSERADSFIAPSSGHRPYAQPHQPINSSGGYPSQDPSLGGRRPPIVDKSFSESMAGPSHLQGPPSHFQGPPSDRFPTSQVQTRPPGSSDSRGYPLPSPSLGGHHLNGNPEGTSHPQDLGRHSSFSEGTSQWQTPSSDRFPESQVTMRPPESGRYLSQDQPSSGGRYLNGDSPYSTGPSHWQNSPSGQFPIPPRPPALSDSHWQAPLSDRYPTSPRPPGSSESSGPLQDPPPSSGRYRSDPSFSEGMSHWQNQPPRPPGSSESGRYPPQDPPSLGGPHRVGDSSFSTGPSHLQNSPSDQFSIPPRPPALDPPHLGGRHLNGPSSGKSHLQGPIVMVPPSESEEHALKDPRSLGGRHPHDDSSFSESMAGPSQWATNRFNGGSESTVIPQGMTRAREGSYSQQQPVDSWGGNDPDDSPPAYIPVVETVGHFSAPPGPGPNSSHGRW